VTYLLDINVLIALSDPAHVHHEAAHRWFSAVGSASWATCPITENGFVRVISSPSYQSIAATPAQAALRLQVSRAGPRTCILARHTVSDRHDVFRPDQAPGPSINHRRISGRLGSSSWRENSDTRRQHSSCRTCQCSTGSGRIDSVELKPPAYQFITGLANTRDLIPFHRAYRQRRLLIKAATTGRRAWTHYFSPEPEAAELIASPRTELFTTSPGFRSWR
jgi:hypothetical protein